MTRFRLLMELKFAIMAFAMSSAFECFEDGFFNLTKILYSKQTFNF